MKTKILFAVTVLFFAFAGNSSAQKLKIVSGSLAPIMKEKTINIEYDFTDFKVGKSKSEKEYIAGKVEEYNKKEPGKGDKWKEGWEGAKESRYQPKFEELINKVTEKSKMTHGVYPEAKYTLIVKTTFIEPGFNVGVMKQPAYASFEFSYVETADHSKVICKSTLLKVVGSQAMGYDFDAGSRIAESYAKGGKILGKNLVK